MEEFYDGDDEVADKDYVITGNSDTSDDEEIVAKVVKEYCNQCTVLYCTVLLYYCTTGLLDWTTVLLYWIVLLYYRPGLLYYCTIGLGWTVLLYWTVLLD